MNISEIFKNLESGVKNVFDSGKYIDYLKVMSRFHNYSAANSMLIMMQRPNATYVAGFNTWNKVFGRTVNRGEKAIKIIAPRIKKDIVDVNVFDERSGLPVIKYGKPLVEKQEIKSIYFTTVNVFDVSQTSGRPLPTLTEELNGSVHKFDKFLGAIRVLAPVPLYIRDIEGDAKGFYDGSKIVIKNGMSEVQTLKTGIHELAHSILHNKDTLNQVVKDKITKEVEAESVAYVVCKRFGIDTGDYSFPYIAGWSNDKDVSVLKDSLETIQREANLIISHIEKALDISIENNIGKLKEQHDYIEVLGKKIDAGIATPDEIAKFNQIQEKNYNMSVAELKDKLPQMTENEFIR